MHRLQQARGQALVRDPLSPLNALRALAPAMSHASREHTVRRRTSPINILRPTMQIFLFKQDPDHTFRPVTNASGLAAINALNKAVYDVIPLDHDRDGDEDLLVAFADDTMSVQLWRNDLGQLASWTSITLEGAGGAGHANRSGIGARIEVTANGITQTREVDAAPGQHAPQAPLTQTLGLARPR
jgi:hypothetical protein